MADQKKFEDEAGKTITKKDVKEFYEKNKESRFRQSPADPPLAQESGPSPTDEESEVKPKGKNRKEKTLKDDPETPSQPEQNAKENAAKDSSKKESKEARGRRRK